MTSLAFKYFWRSVACFTWDWFSSPIVQLQFLEVSQGEPRLTGRAWSQGSQAWRAIPCPAQHSTGSGQRRDDIKHKSASGAGSCQLNLLEQSWNRNKPWCKQLNSWVFICAHFQTASKRYSLLVSLQTSQVYSKMTHSVTEGEGTIFHMCQRRPMR